MEEFDLRKYLADNTLLREDGEDRFYKTEWDNMSEEERLYTLLAYVKDPDEAEELVNKSFHELPDEIEAALFENQTINEGQFSWFTQDTNRQIGSEEENTIDVYMVDNEGNSYHEPKYDGYGEFGGMDYYDVLATMNGFTEEDIGIKNKRGHETTELRGIGIDIAFEGIDSKEGEVLFPALVADPKRVDSSWDFTKQPESDPNQSWHEEEEEDDDDWGGYDDDDEDEY